MISTTHQAPNSKQFPIFNVQNYKLFRSLKFDYRTLFSIWNLSIEVCRLQGGYDGPKS